jgi:hypothetical protein
MNTNKLHRNRKLGKGVALAFAVLSLVVSGSVSARVTGMICTKIYNDRTYSCSVFTSTAQEPVVVRAYSNTYFYNGDFSTKISSTSYGARFDFTAYARSSGLPIFICAGNRDPDVTSEAICRKFGP